LAQPFKSLRLAPPIGRKTGGENPKGEIKGKFVMVLLWRFDFGQYRMTRIRLHLPSWNQRLGLSHLTLVAIQRPSSRAGALA
jgi:hypothetical protein